MFIYVYKCIYIYIYIYIYIISKGAKVIASNYGGSEKLDCYQKSNVFISLKDNK